MVAMPMEQWEFFSLFKKWPCHCFNGSCPNLEAFHITTASTITERYVWCFQWPVSNMWLIVQYLELRLYRFINCDTSFWIYLVVKRIQIVASFTRKKHLIWLFSDTTSQKMYFSQLSTFGSNVMPMVFFSFPCVGIPTLLRELNDFSRKIFITKNCV